MFEDVQKISFDSNKPTFACQKWVIHLIKGNIIKIQYNMRGVVDESSFYNGYGRVLSRWI